MALTSEQKSSRLFKKAFGLAETLTTRDFFEEGFVGPSLVMPSQIWTEADKIPSTAPILNDGEVSGAIQYYEALELTHASGAQDRSYADDRLKDALDFTVDATYNYKLYENDGTTVIPDGLGDWLVDREAGVLTFYGTIPSGVNAANPPKISFYKYAGEKGLQISGATSGINVKDPVVATTIEELSGVTYSDALSGFTSLPTDIDGVSIFNDGNRFLIKNQSNANQNGIYEVLGTTLIRAEDHDGDSFGEVGINDYTFVVSGATLIATSWVIGSTDATDPNNIIPGADEQNWKLFSESKAYEADERGIKLQNGNTFYIDLDDGGVYDSGLEQSVDGIRVQPAILSSIVDNASGLTSLSTEISSIDTQISSLQSTDVVLSTEISTIEDTIGNLDGDGLSYSGNTLNVNVDEFTVKVVNDEIRGQQTWIQNSSTVNISGGTSGFTGITLDHEPVTPVFAYVNGIEYLIAPATVAQANFPFYYSAFPPELGTEIGYDSTISGFDLESGVDLVTIKFSYIDIT